MTTAYATHEIRATGATRVLLGCGILSSLAYVAANVVASASWPEYSSLSQTVSELSAIGAPSRAAWLAFGTAYTLLLIAFGVGVWQTAPGKRGLRIAAGTLIAIGVLGPFWPPMHLRGMPMSLTDIVHIAFASVTSLLILLSIGFGATALGRWFRGYSIATLAVLLVFGTLTFLAAPHLAAHQPTPRIGLYERIDVGGFLLWVAVLATGLLRDRARLAQEAS